MFVVDAKKHLLISFSVYDEVSEKPKHDFRGKVWTPDNFDGYM